MHVYAAGGIETGESELPCATASNYVQTKPL